MKTTVSVCTLCLLLCVAGSYAATIGGRAGGQPASSSTPNNVPINNAAHKKAVSAVSDGIKYAIENLTSGEPTDIAVSSLVNDIQTTFADFIDDYFKLGHGLEPPEDCTKTQINVDLVSKQFSQAVRQALEDHEDYYINLSSECLSKAMLDLSLEITKVVNEERCIYEDRFTIGQYLDLYRFYSNLYDNVENVILGMVEKDENRARNCYTHDDFFF